jgi:TonB-dependent receptor
MHNYVKLLVTWTLSTSNFRLLFLQHKNECMQKYLTVIIVLFSVTLFNAQTGKISGSIVDAKTGETLPGATAMVEGTGKGASADFDGKFIIPGIPVGKVTLVISYISYTTKKINGIEVKANDVTDVNVLLDASSSADLAEVEVVVTLNKENNTALVLQQKNNASVSDGISSETIRKTPDRTTSDVIKRISGATIQDNKFAIIRGMSDRYNAAYINGAPLPSSESDKKAFSFDIFPANLLDNIVILKTATPDLPGDFAGGVIQINTKSIPEKNAQSISISAGYNTQTTFKNFKTYSGGKYDWLGLDDGTRALPKGLPDTKDYSTDKLEQIDYAKQVNYDWSLKNKSALPNYNLQYSTAHVGKLFKKDAGSIFALTYNNNTNTFFTTRREFEEQGTNYDVVKTRDYKDTTFSNTILTSALWNLSLKLNGNNQIGFKNLFSINSEDRVITRKGSQDINTQTWEKSNIRWFTQNQIYSGQINGDHYHEKSQIKVKWVGGYSAIEREIPNLRRMTYVKNAAEEDDTTRYNAVIATNGTAAQNAGTMIFNTTKEKMQSIRYDISKSVKIKNTKHEIQLGGNHIFRDRTFFARLLGYSMYRQNSSLRENTDLKYLDESVIFSPENIGISDKPGPAKGGFKLSEATTEKDNYAASSMLHAGYAMIDSRFGEKFRFIYGARLESYNQKLTATIFGEEKRTDTTVIDLLPSINAVYSVNSKTNLRFSYYKTVSRPEFRELAAFNFLDFNTTFNISGNPGLTRAKIDNYDVRFELFPGAGQIISVSGFYKRITNAVEQAVDASAQIRSLTFVNVELVENTGFELEYRFKLSTLLNKDSSEFLSNTTLFTNFAYIKSKVDVSKILDAEPRPLQGQSPYIVNAGIQYLDNEKGWGISASYNLIGRRIVIVGATSEPSYWENPRHVIDLQLVKTFKEKFEIKFNIRDLLAQNQIWYQDINKNGKLDKNSEADSKNNTHSNTLDNVMANTKLAPTLSLSFLYRF